MIETSSRALPTRVHVPLGPVSAWLSVQSEAERTRVAALVAQCLVSVGARRELHLERLAAHDAELAAILDAYRGECERFWERVRAGESIGAFVSIRRPLSLYVQQDSAAGRVDLGAQLEAFGSIPGLDSFLEALTDPVVDSEKIAQAGLPVCGELAERKGGLRAVATLPSPAAWPASLGGACSEGEVQRRFVIEVSHAKWRDRRVRRLTRVEVQVEEVWPDPSA